MTAAILLLTCVTLSRLLELRRTRRNTAALMERGAIECAPGRYPLILMLHGSWLSILWWMGWSRELVPIWVAIFAVLQVPRVWVHLALGPRWTTRIIILPGAPLVRSGPYRFVSYPNYLVVFSEIAVLPLCFGLPWVALLFSILNAGLLAIRIRAENAGLAGQPQNI